MKNTFGNAVSLTIFGESHGPRRGRRAGRPGRRAAGGRGGHRRRHGPPPRPRGRAFPPRAPRRRSGVSFRRVRGSHHRHPRDAADPQPEHPQRRLRQNRRPFAPRPRDFTAYAKYGGCRTRAAGGIFSGRVTAASVAAGALCERVLQDLGIRVYTHIAVCAGVEDAPLSSAAGLVLPQPAPGHFALLDPAREAAMQEAIRAAGRDGDSVGGILETIVTGLPAGIGEPWFDSVESELSHLLFAIPALQGRGVRRRVPLCGHARQRGQRPLCAARRPYRNRHQPQRRRQRRHHQRHAAGTAHRHQTDAQHLQRAAHRRLRRPPGGFFADPGPARPLHRTAGRPWYRTP